MLKVILIGYGELASSIMLGVLESQHELVGVFRWEKVNSNPIISFFKDLFVPDNFYSLIKSYKISEIKANSANSEKFLKEALKLHPDVIIIGSWGEKLKEATIILPRIACVNCHPSLLPKHRGSNPYASVIKNGEKASGITFHLVDKNIDTGSILLQKEVSISNEDTGYSLRIKASQAAREAVQELLDGLENAKFLPKKQDESESSYFPALSDEDAKINWNKTAQEIHNQIRGLYPWIKCYTLHKDNFLMIDSSKIIELDNPAVEPGKILSKKKNALIVSTSDPKQALMIDGLEVYGFIGKIWSEQYIYNKINIGDKLEEL